ncbi:hypothetical protein ACF3DV_11500 [Chlorogloeopsis fritschii PCC 9212]
MADSVCVVSLLPIKVLMPNTSRLPVRPVSATEPSLMVMVVEIRESIGK